MQRRFFGAAFFRASPSVCLLQERRYGLVGCGGYEQVQDALFWMEDKGLIKAQSTGVLGSYGDIYQATITTLGQDFMDNDYSFPLTKIEVTLNEKQLEALLLILVEKFGKPGEASAVRRLFEKAGNAGVNALATEAVKQMLAHLPEIARTFM